MASIRDIRRKIRVVKNISQITQAMKMVAAAKLRRVQERVQKGKPYSQTMAELVGTLAPRVTEFSHPLLDVREVSRIGIVVIAADKGLCGSYNSAILRLSQNFVDKKIGEVGGAGNARIVTVGRKAGDYFRKRDYEVAEHFPSVGPEAPYEQVRAISNAITGMYLSGAVDEVYICYTEFITTIAQRPQAIKFLPIEPPASEEEDDASTRESGAASEYIYEPSAEELLSVLLPRFVETRVYQLLMEAVASEFGARMTAMTNATKNAGDQIESLTLLANRTRQASITTEILEIVGGAEALKG